MLSFFLLQASSDLSILDFDIPFSVIFVVAASIELLAMIGIMAAVTWQVLIVAILAVVAAKYVQVGQVFKLLFLGFLSPMMRRQVEPTSFFCLKGYYQASARELIRINGTTKAPVMNYAAETSLGVITIRAFNMADRFFQNYQKLIDTDARLFFYSNVSMEWLTIRIEFLQNLTLFTAAFLLVLVPKGLITPGIDYFVRTALFHGIFSLFRR